MTRSEGFVQVNEITKAYPGTSKLAVSEVSFSLHSGEILALLGPNGAGKTTTVKMAAGLITPTSGTISVMGHDIVGERRMGIRHIGAVLEGARNLYWRLSAVENLRYFGNLRLVPRQELNGRISELLSLFGLSEHKHKEVGKFSRGMQQKLAITAALLHDPKVLLLDEPTLGLDVQAAKQLEKSIVELARQEGKAILLTTHMMDLAERLADQIYVINQGQKVAYDSTSALLEQYNGQRKVTEIQVVGGVSEPLIPAMQHAFPEVSTTADAEFTRITWPSIEQEKVMQLLNFLNEQGVTILSVGRRQASLEEVFLSLTDSGAP
jgi:ABC-2 type transport system ATP-binding protein